MELSFGFGFSDGPLVWAPGFFKRLGSMGRCVVGGFLIML